jgi:coenzyme F420-reducing hydrogenase delta subunit
MVPRTDQRKWPAQSEVIASKCVGCGICAGSCDSAGIGLAWLDVVATRARIDGWLAAAGEPTAIAFVCAQSAGRGLRFDAASGRCAELPGYRVVGMPCAGWLHPLTVERALRRGAAGVLIAGCAGCAYREGARWTERRLDGRRGTGMRPDKVDAGKVQWLPLPAGGPRGLIAAARAFRATLAGGGAAARPADRPVTPRAVLAGLALAAACAALIWVPSDLPYATAAGREPALVVSFKHPGVISESCRQLSAEELARKPVHLRQPMQCERSRAPVRMRVRIDGGDRLEQSYRPGGLFEDGSSIAVETLSVSPGRHRVVVDLADTQDGTWTHHEEREVEFRAGRREVLLFDRGGGFTWH